MCLVEEATTTSAVLLLVKHMMLDVAVNLPLPLPAMSRHVRVPSVVDVL